MFGISGIEFFMILAVALLIFGPEEMPRIGRIIGQALRMFNDARREVEQVMTDEILRPEEMDMLKDPLGMKSMSKDLGNTMMQMADPKYKPIPKGTGMRVATDDVTQAARRQARTAQRKGTSGDVASIWGVAAASDSQKDTGQDAEKAASPREDKSAQRGATGGDTDAH